LRRMVKSVETGVSFEEEVSSTISVPRGIKRRKKKKGAPGSMLRKESLRGTGGGLPERGTEWRGRPAIDFAVHSVGNRGKGKFKLEARTLLGTVKKRESLTSPGEGCTRALCESTQLQTGHATSAGEEDERDDRVGPRNW